MKKILIYTLILLNIQAANGAWRLPITNYPIEKSEAGRQSWKIAEGANGWIYFANNDGLLEFNGAEWRIHKIDNGSIIRAVATTENGEIYVGALGEFGRFSPDQSGRLTYTNLSDELENRDDNFRREIWSIHTTENLIHFRSRREVITLNYHNELVIKPNASIALASCEMNNNVYVATAEGLYVVAEGTQLQISADDIIPYEQICAMVDFGYDRLLVATNFDGLYIFKDGKFSRFESSADDILKQNQVFSIDVNDTYIACGTVSRGVILIARNGESHEIIEAINGLQNNTVLSLLFDSRNRLWCGLDNGISCIYTSSPLRHYSSELGNSFTGYCTHIGKEYIYFGTNQGLVYSPKGEMNSLYSNSSSLPELVSNSNGQVWGITKVGSKLYCAHTRGLFVIDESRSPHTLHPVYSEDGVWGITPIDSERYLIGTYEGVLLMHHNADNISSISKIRGYSNSAQKIVLHTPYHSAFIIDANGLEHLSFNADYTEAHSKLIIPNNSFEIKILKIAEQIIIYTPEQIYRVDEMGNVQPTDEYDTILCAGNRYTLLEIDNNNDIWYIEDGRLLRRRFNHASNSYEESREIFYEDRHLFIPRFATIQEIDSRYYIINNIYGFSIVDSTSPRSRLNNEEPVVIGIYDTANRDSLILSEAYGVRHSHIKLPYSQNSIRITFGSNNTIEENIQYSYMLKGSDNNWSEWSSKKSITEAKNIYNQKEYTNLREGHYRFNLRLQNEYGETKESHIDITILPPWQRSKAMYMLYLIVIIVVALYAQRRIVRHFALRRRLLEIQNAREIENHKRAYRSKSIEHENNIIRLKNDRLESEVKLKSAELSNLLLNKLEKNDIIKDVKGNLEKIRVEIVNARTDMANKRIVHLNKYLDDKMIDNVDWGTFEKNFDLINNNFAQKIQERYSWMTANERKLCIYIKMGLQNKEIAPLLNLSVRGVEMLRYRVRKKMELSRDISLYDLFQSI